jgi:hypothetical protein
MQGGLQPSLQQKQSAPAEVDSKEIEHKAACTGRVTRTRKVVSSASPWRGRQQRAQRGMQGPRSAARVTVAASPCRLPPSCTPIAAQASGQGIADAYHGCRPDGSLQPSLQQKQSAPDASVLNKMEHQAAHLITRCEVTVTSPAAHIASGCRGQQERAWTDVQGHRSAARIAVAATPCRSPPSCAVLLASSIPPRGGAKPPERRAACNSPSSSSRRAGVCRWLPRLPRRRHTRVAPL